MSNGQQVTHGVDRETSAAFADHAAENSEDAQFELGARSTYEGTYAHSLANVDVTVDAPAEVPADDRGVIGDE